MGTHQGGLQGASLLRPQGRHPPHHDRQRNLRPSFSVNVRRRHDVFHAAFDAFCLRWNLYGMQHDEPLPLKLAVNLTPYGTMIHIPSYWSFDPKRDIRWDAIARLHRVRVPGRQGPALAEGLAKRLKAAEKMHFLQMEAARLGLKGEKKHEFLCAGLGWDPRTSPKRIRDLQAKFKNPSLEYVKLVTKKIIDQYRGAFISLANK